MTRIVNPRLALCGVVLASLVVAGCRPPMDHSERGRGSKHSAKSSEPRVSVPAKSEAKSEAKKAPRETPPANKPIIHEVVRSALPHMTIPEADEDAIEQARKRVGEKLAAMNPPIRQVPPLSAVREQYVRKESRVVRKPTEEEQAVIDRAGLEPNQVYVEYTVELTEPQIRQLRMHDRLVDALRVAGGLFVVCLAGFVFLRADEWSRGYLTSWLGLLAGVGVVAGLVAVLTFKG